MIIVCPKCGLEGKSSIDINKVKKLKCKKCKHIFSVRSFDNEHLEENSFNEESPAIIKSLESDSSDNIEFNGNSHILTVISGIDQGKIHIINKRKNIIGRKNTDIILNDPMISRQHATIEIYNQKAMIKDLGSSNGILYNGKRVKIVILNNGDKIQLGETIIRYTFND